MRWLGIAALLLLQGCALGTEEVTTVGAILGRPDAAATAFVMEDGTLIIEVTSPSGIGSAELTISGPMPKRAVLRLWLKGLEGLEVSYGETVVTASLLGTTGSNLMEAIRLASGEEELVTPSSPYWMAVQVVPTGPSPTTIPLAQGYIEISLPEHFFRSKERTVAIRWVDFYR